MYSLLFCFMSVFLISWEVSSVSVLLAAFLGLLLMCRNWEIICDSIFLTSSLSSLLIILSCILVFLCFITSPYEKMKLYCLLLLSLGFLLCMCFSMSNMIMFYIFFEASLIPTLILIISWGYQPERLMAGSYMMLYTVGASLPLLLVLVWFCSDASTTSIPALHWSMGSMLGFLVPVIYGAFLVKLPVYGVHLWLPKAHVEAPLVGSMILAGVLLKLGGYGLHVMNTSFNIGYNFASVVLVSISVWGGVLVSLTCLRQVDVKALVAYSSVAHMSIVSAGMLLDTVWGYTSAVITMIAHGFSSSALFCLSFFSYEKSHTRNMPYMKGLLQLFPMLSLWWFLFCCISMAAPPTINLVGELFISVALWSNSLLLAISMGLMVFFSAAYNMYLYVMVNHGCASSYLSAGKENSSFEYLSLILHITPLLLIMKSEIFM